MKPTSRFMLFYVLLIMVVLTAAAVSFIVVIDRNTERSALLEQDQYLRLFWKLLNDKGQEFRIADEKMLLGNKPLNGNNEIPDEMFRLFGCRATIFMSNVRISTNVLDKYGSRATGTKLEGPAYDAVFRQGKPFRGEAPILGVPYLTAYDPIRNGRGEIIGALFVGIDKNSSITVKKDLRTTVLSLTAVLILLFSFFGVVLLRIGAKTEKAILSKSCPGRPRE
jgi:methyl-accepting chemotaxis protein